MSLKSILRALGLARPHSGPQSLGDAVRGVTPQATPFLDRLTSRSDWHTAGPQTQIDPEYYRRADPHTADPAPLVAPWDRPRPISTDGDGVDLSGRGPPDLWPVTDDPYVDPEPCKVVQDEGLSTIRDYAARTNENTRKLTERGLTGRLENLKIVGDILDLVERQDAAEKKLNKLGYAWVGKMWCRVGDGSEESRQT